MRFIVKSSQEDVFLASTTFIQVLMTPIIIEIFYGCMVCTAVLMQRIFALISRSE